MSTQEELTRRLQAAIAAQQAIGDARSTAAIAADNAVEAQAGAETARDTTEGYLQDAQAAKVAAEAAATGATAARSGAETAAGEALASASTAQGYAAAAANSIAACETAQEAAEKAAEDAHSLLDNTLQADHENTFTAAQTFHAPVTVGTPRVAAVWASKSVVISDANMRKAGTISDNDGHTLDIPEDATRTQNQFAALVEASSLGLKVTHIGTTYRFYDAASPAGQEGTVGNTRRLYANGLGWASQQTWALAGGKDGVEEVGYPMMLNGNVYIGHGPEGVKARCFFGITVAYLVKSGTIADNNPNHPLAIELPEDPARTIDSCIAEINEQGYKLEVKASKYNAATIRLESTETGSAANSIVFTRTGCFSTAAAGTAQTTTQGSDIQGLDEGAASDWELRQNGYPVASRQTNNVYEGVQVFNNAVALNGAITGAGLPGLLDSHLKEAESVIGYHMLQKDYADKTYPATALLQENRAGDEIVYARTGTGLASQITKPIRNILMTKGYTTSARGTTYKDAYVISLEDARLFRYNALRGTMHVLVPEARSVYMHFHESDATNAIIYYSAPQAIFMGNSGSGIRVSPFQFSVAPSKFYISMPNLEDASTMFVNRVDFELQDDTLSKCKAAEKLFGAVSNWTAVQVLRALAALSDWSADPDLPEEGYPLSLPAAAAFYEAVHQWWESRSVPHAYTAGEAPVPEEPLPLGWNVTYF